MGILPSAPRIALRLPRAIHAGRSFVADVEITAREAVRLDWIDARLETKEQWTVGSQDDAVSRTERMVSLAARLFPGGVLAAGAHRLPVRFDLPPGTPPSMRIASATVETLLHVEASIPWWPDARASYVIPVRAAPRALSPAPYRATNQERGSGVPRIEISLASRTVAARGVLAGAIAFFHHDPGVLAGAYLALRASTRLISASGHVRSSGATAYTIALPQALPADGTPVPFRVRVPDDVAATFASRAVQLEWRLQVERRGLFSTDAWIAIPIEIVETGDDVDPTAGLEVPPIGDSRLAQVLESVARALGLAREDDALTGAGGAVSFRIRRALRPGIGSTLTAEIDLPRLGIGLSVEPARVLPQLLQGDVAIGDDAFDAAHRVEARESAQARAFLEPLAPLFADGALAVLDDERAILSVPDATLDERSLIDFAERVRGVARAIDAAIAAVPPPGAAEADRDAWDEVARALAGRAVIGDLSVSGRLGESEVAIETDLVAREHVVYVRPSPAIPAGVSLAIADPRGAPPRALAEALLALPEGARELVVGDGTASVRPPLSIEHERARSDPRAALRAAGLLARLGTLLAPGRGPFR